MGNVETSQQSNLRLNYVRNTEGVVTGGKITQYQNHHWWPKELGGANRAGAVVRIQSANPNLHTATDGIHPNMRAYFKNIFGISTWRAAKIEFFKLDFNTQYQLLENFYITQGMKMPNMIIPGIIPK